MAQFVAYNKETEVNGHTILSVVKGMPGFELTAMGLLEKHGILNVKESGWYSQQAWLDTFRDIADNIGEQTLIAIGTKIIASAQWPPAVNSLESALASIDIAYHINHRIHGKILFDPAKNLIHEGIGHYSFEKINENEFRITCDNPYPCDFDKGIIKGVVNRFKPANVNVDLFESTKNECRKKGGNKCIHLIRVN